MTDRETFVLVKLLPDLLDGDISIRKGHVYYYTVNDDDVEERLIGHALELEHDIEIEVDAEPGDATTGRWRRRFLGKWQVGAHWEEDADGSGS